MSQHSPRRLPHVSAPHHTHELQPCADSHAAQQRVADGCRWLLPQRTTSPGSSVLGIAWHWTLTAASMLPPTAPPASLPLTTAREAAGGDGGCSEARGSGGCRPCAVAAAWAAIRRLQMTKMTEVTMARSTRHCGQRNLQRFRTRIVGKHVRCKMDIYI